MGASHGVVIAVLAHRSPALEAVLDDVRRRLADHAGFSFPRRLITLPVAPGDELHQTVSPAQFEELRRGGQLCCPWSDAGRNFALPRSVEDDLGAGRRVVVAVSPQALPALAELGAPIILVRLLRPDDEADEPIAADCCEREIELHPGGADDPAEQLVRALLALPGRRRAEAIAPGKSAAP